MKTRLFCIVVAVLCLFLFPSCGDDDPYIPPRVPPKGPNYPDLTQKDHIFEYLELVWEYMDIDAYAKLLDEDFIFWFSQADYNDGITPEYWGRTEELSMARNMFSGFSHPKYGAVTGIDLEVIPEGLWIEIPKTEPPYAGETWYQRTAEYRLIVSTTSEWTLQGQEKKALFTVRQSELDGKNIYRIVMWHDDIQ
jgi:hypothetical protein